MVLEAWSFCCCLLAVESICTQYMNLPISHEDERSFSPCLICLKWCCFNNFFLIALLKVGQASKWGLVFWKVSPNQFGLPIDIFKLIIFQIISSHMSLELCCWMMKLLTPRSGLSDSSMAQGKTATSSSPRNPVTIQMIP